MISNCCDRLHRKRARHAFRSMSLPSVLFAGNFSESVPDKQTPFARVPDAVACFRNQFGRPPAGLIVSFRTRRNLRQRGIPVVKLIL